MQRADVACCPLPTRAASPLPPRPRPASLRRCNSAPSSSRGMARDRSAWSSTDHRRADLRHRLRGDPGPLRTRATARSRPTTSSTSPSRSADRRGDRQRADLALPAAGVADQTSRSRSRLNLSAHCLTEPISSPGSAVRCSGTGGPASCSRWSGRGQRGRRLRARQHGPRRPARPGSAAVDGRLRTGSSSLSSCASCRSTRSRSTSPRAGHVEPVRVSRSSPARSSSWLTISVCSSWPRRRGRAHPHLLAEMGSRQAAGLPGPATPDDRLDIWLLARTGVRSPHRGPRTAACSSAPEKGPPCPPHTRMLAAGPCREAEVVRVKSSTHSMPPL